MFSCFKVILAVSHCFPSLQSLVEVDWLEKQLRADLNLGLPSLACQLLIASYLTPCDGDQDEKHSYQLERKQESHCTAINRVFFALQHYSKKAL